MDSAEKTVVSLFTVSLNAQAALSENVCSTTLSFYSIFFQKLHRFEKRWANALTERRITDRVLSVAGSMFEHKLKRSPCLASSGTCVHVDDAGNKRRRAGMGKLFSRLRR
jgi:hypothetical protein